MIKIIYFFLKKTLSVKNVVRKIYLLLLGQASIIENEELNYLRTVNTTYSDSIKLEKMRPPVFVIGPPRSGSTFLVAALNVHENIYITNELRVMSFVNDLFRLFLKSDRIEWDLSSGEKSNFLAHFRVQMAYVVKSFYAQRLKNNDDVWGDKHPHYSDPALDPGALDTILELFPDARFIHLYRHPYAQIYSYVKKGWKDFQYAVLAYKRIVTVGRSLGRRLNPKQYVEISYEDLCDNGMQVANRICAFLEIPPSEKLNQYMINQELNRTPYSIPITPAIEIGKKTNYEFSGEQKEYMQKMLGDLVGKLGYTLN